MALTLGQGAQLLADISFNARVRGAMIRAALNVAAEAQAALSTNAWVKRRQLSTRILNSPDAYADDFAAAVAADPGSALAWFAPVPIASSTNANPTAVTTAAVHGLSSGDVAAIVGHAANTNANGAWVVTVTSTTAFTIPQPGNAVGAATGTVQKQETDSNLAFTVNSVFSAIAGLLPGE